MENGAETYNDTPVADGERGNMTVAEYLETIRQANTEGIEYTPEALGFVADPREAI